ncbi:putative RNA-binding Zn ribbon-like protein [Saccharothrix carnea]|uniref:Putative RNA-binding Zn ribbon-like protein n=1 Tax=Saccharothrix carnea TaxID=1280637 RepID=A0A2P8I0W2_SACCR|nr:ABATE domain-containing protein [Saccharothrix carnea]PSL52107.1 putative RNA-binding Zn ribbon-like protein [Saccharothrix carnea]
MDTDAPLLGEPLPVELMNTVWADRDGVHDALRDRDGVRAWLRALCPRTDLLTPNDLDELTASDLDRLIGVRDALRRLAAEVTEDPRPTAASDPSALEAAVTVLNEAAGDTPRWSALSWTPGRQPARHTRTSGRAIAATVSAIAEDAIALFSQDTRHQLRACLGPGCVLYFVKHHPRREWCSAGCGNRARSARHYQRHRGTTS